MPTVSVFRGLMCLGIDNAWRNLCLEIIYRDCLGPGASLFLDISYVQGQMGLANQPRPRIGPA